MLLKVFTRFFGQHQQRLNYALSLFAGWGHKNVNVCRGPIVTVGKQCVSPDQEIVDVVFVERLYNHFQVGYRCRTGIFLFSHV